MLTIIEILAGLMAETAIVLFWWLVLFPLVLLVSLPFILVRAACQKPAYGLAVTNMVAAVYMFWQEWGGEFVP